MKKALFCLLLPLLLAPLGAFAGINAPASIPADTVWSFSVSLPAAGEFSSARIFLDGTQVAKVNGDSGIYFPPNSVESSRILSNAIGGNTAFFSVAALGKGTHTLKMQVDSIDPESREIYFFEVFNAESQRELQSQLDSVRGSVNSLITQFNSLEEKSNGALTASDKEELLAGIKELGSLAEALQAELELQKSENAAAQGEIQSLSGEMSSLKGKPVVTGSGAGAGVAGFFSAAILDSGAGMALIAVIVAAVFAVLLVKNRGRLRFRKSIYAKAEKAEEVSSINTKEVTEVLEEMEKKGKWAFVENKAAGEPKKPFSMGEIIRRK